MKMNRRREERQEEAIIRQEEHDKLSIEEKISKLNIKFGKNKGAKKERVKLNGKVK